MARTRPLPFDVAPAVRDRCLCLHLQRAARVVARLFDDAFRHLGLTNGQFSLMMALNRPEPARMSQVATVLGMDRTTLTAALKPLERRGLVKVAADPADRRSRLMSLTPPGAALLAEAFPLWKRTHALVDRRLVKGAPERLRDDLLALSAPASEEPE
jgi:DNA-binding MarR family transcriptional regulator